jgi:hypothetical protein
MSDRAERKKELKRDKSKFGLKITLVFETNNPDNIEDIIEIFIKDMI